VIGVLDEKGMEVDDEQLREIIVELCYWPSSVILTKRYDVPYLINTSDAYMGCQRWQMKPVVWTRKSD